MESPQTIIHTEAAAGWGGQELRTFTECQWFHKQGWRIVLLAKEGSPIWKNFNDAGMESIHVDFTKKTQIKDLKRCYSIFEKERPLVVATHSNIDTRVALLAAKLAGVKHRIRYRHVSIPVKPNPWNKIIYRSLATNIVTTGDCISKPLIDNLKLAPEKVHTIPTGIVPPDDLIERNQARLDVCKQLNLPDNTRFIGQVSVLRRWKGQKDVMDGFDEIADKHPEHHLIFVGGGHGEEYLPPMAAEKKHKDRIHFLGHQTNPWPYFRAMDINLLASTEGEGIPQVGMQSMLCETPFIGTTIGGIPEIIEDGVTGLLVAPNNPEQISKAIDKLLSDNNLSAQIAEQAHTWAKKYTTIDLQAERFLQLIQ